MPNRLRRCHAGFTLIEISIVVLILGLLLAAALQYAANQSAANNVKATITALDTIETALVNYANFTGRLPCPSDITVAESSASFGTEVGTYGTNCTGANRTSGNVYAGGVPNKALGLPDNAAYDAWGRRIKYVVDQRMTLFNAMTINPYSSTIGDIVVNTAGSASTITSHGIYALVSHGSNGHGGYSRAMTSTATAYNSLTGLSSGNSDELINCSCTYANAAMSSGTFNGTFVQATTSKVAGSTTDEFDDLVRFKTRTSISTNVDQVK